MILPQSRVSQSDQQVSTVIDGELVSLSLKQSKYFKLDRIGVAVWERIDKPRTVEELCSCLASEFDVSPEQCLSDTVSFLVELEEAGLVTID